MKLLGICRNFLRTSTISNEIFRMFSKKPCRKTKPHYEREKPKRVKVFKPIPSIHPVHQGGYKVWRNMFFFLSVPLITFQTYTCYSHWHPHERPPFVKYEYLRRRTKRFPWGDGQRSLFHNPRVNALPDGYEDVEEVEIEKEPED